MYSITALSIIGCTNSEAVDVISTRIVKELAEMCLFCYRKHFYVIRSTLMKYETSHCLPPSAFDVKCGRIFDISIADITAIPSLSTLPLIEVFHCAFAALRVDLIRLSTYWKLSNCPFLLTKR